MQKNLDSRERMIVRNAWRLMQKGEKVEFSELTEVCFGNLKRARVLMSVINANVQNYNALKTKTARIRYESNGFSFKIP